MYESSNIDWRWPLIPTNNLSLDSKYKWSGNISTVITTNYLKGLLIRKVLVSSQFMSMYNCSLKMKQETTNLLDVYLPHWTVACYRKRAFHVMVLWNILFVNKVSIFYGYVRSDFANCGLCTVFWYFQWYLQYSKCYKNKNNTKILIKTNRTRYSYKKVW